jgi:hypothetical protein
LLDVSALLRSFLCLHYSTSLIFNCASLLLLLY